MTLRRGWLVCWFLCLGCQSVGLSESESDGRCPGANPECGASQAIYRPLGFFEPTLTGHSQATRSHLSQAADHLEKGEETSACEHLGQYLADHPEHFEVRVHYAELLWRQARFGDAQVELTKSIAQAQELGDKTMRLRIHCHSLLMEIADAQDDDYGLHYHRGVGLYLIGLERAKLPDRDGMLPVEGLLCRAAGELALARAERPAAAHPCWYLYQVWSALGQQGPATRWLQRTLAAAPFSQLTPTEQRSMHLAMSASSFRVIRP